MLEVSKQFVKTQSDKASKEMAMDFLARIVIASPVAEKNSQRSRLLWTSQPIDGGYSVSNSAAYMPVLWAGRIFDGKQWRGSLQMPSGGYPVLLQTVERFRR